MSGYVKSEVRTSRGRSEIQTWTPGGGGGRADMAAVLLPESQPVETFNPPPTF